MMYVYSQYVVLHHVFMVLVHTMVEKHLLMFYPGRGLKMYLIFMYIIALSYTSIYLNDSLINEKLHVLHSDMQEFFLRLMLLVMPRQSWPHWGLVKARVTRR